MDWITQCALLCDLKTWEHHSDFLSTVLKRGRCAIWPQNGSVSCPLCEAFLLANAWTQCLGLSLSRLCFDQSNWKVSFVISCTESKIPPPDLYCVETIMGYASYWERGIDQLWLYSWDREAFSIEDVGGKTWFKRGPRVHQWPFSCSNHVICPFTSLLETFW